MMIHCKRVYDLPAERDGYRVLVDRIWPRGVKKSALHYDEWAKDLAPSTTLRQQLHGEIIDFNEFRRRYLLELQASQEIAQKLANRARLQTVTLLFAAKNIRQNHALVLADFLQNCAR